MRTNAPPWALAAVLVWSAGCFYNGSDRCSAGQVLDEQDTCVCAPDHVPVYRDITVITPLPDDVQPVAYCRPCDDTQVAKNGECVCKPGMVKTASGCIASNLGTACASDADCAPGDVKYCRLPEGYCTSQGCATNADCSADADYACNTTATPTFCKRPPLNQGKACTTTGVDPACGTEAPICAMGSCFATGCMVDSDCSPSRKCCDLSAFQPGVHACWEKCL